MMKRVLAMLLAAMLLVMLAACGTGGGDSTSAASDGAAASEGVPAAEKATEEKIVTISGWEAESNLENVFNALNEKLNGEYEIEYLYIALNEYSNVISTQLAAGEGPDIITETADFPTRIRAGNLVDITDESYLENFEKNVAFSATSADGRIYGFPAYGWFSGVWVNKDILAENGIEDLPKTFDELLDICATLTANGVQPLSVGLSDTDTLEHSMMGFLNNTFTLSDEGKAFNESFAKGETTLVEGLEPYVEQWYQLIGDGYVNEGMLGISGEQALNDFLAGTGAFYNGGQWNYNQMKEAGLNVAFIPNLGMLEEPVFVSGGASTNFGINVNARNMDGAKKVMELLASAEIQQLYINASPGSFTYCKGVTVEFPEEYDAVHEQLENGQVTDWQYWSGPYMPFSAFFLEMRAQQQGLVAGEVTVQGFLEVMDKKADSLRYDR